LKKSVFWVVYSLLLVAVAIGGLEFLASFWTPSWPARDLRPIEASVASVAGMRALAGRPDLVPSYNSWGLRDRERTFDRPTNVHFRAVLVGDSFLEGPFVPEPLGNFVEKDWASRGIGDSEAINLGVSATGPIQYYYRIKKIALKLRPDVILELAAGDVPNREIARRLALSENTVKWYWKRIFGKLCVRRRLQAVNSARAAGVIF